MHINSAWALRSFANWIGDQPYPNRPTGVMWKKMATIL